MPMNPFLPADIEDFWTRLYIYWMWKYIQHPTIIFFLENKLLVDIVY